MHSRPDNFADEMVDEKIAISEYSLSASVGLVLQSLFSSTLTVNCSAGCMRKGEELSHIA